MLDYAEIIQEVRDAFNTGRTKKISYRKGQLKALLQMYSDNEKAIALALAQDMRKCNFEAVLFEVNVLKNDVHTMLANIDAWAAPEKVARTIATSMDTPVVYHDPYGVVLVMGAWNYPFQLSLVPVSGAIAAGNACVIKPSEMAPASSALIAKLVPQYLDEEMYRVLEGGIPETTAILKEKFDYIMYTGSTPVGRIVREASNRHLTPVTLELGGKSPVYIDKDTDMEKTVQRIIWGKLVNAGQTCIAPDYILCSKQVQEEFVVKAREVIAKFYGADPKTSPDYCRIINDRHTERLASYLTCGTIVIGGEVDKDDRYIAPTVMTDVDVGSAVMREEIFGPILPIVNVQSVNEAVAFINAREKPLALYIFSRDDKNVIQPLIARTSAGGITVNDVVFHFSVEEMPFGGVGHSGMGAYHGKDSFLTFSHRKSCLIRNFNPIADWLGSKRCAPYTDANLASLLQLTKPRWTPNWSLVSHALALGVGVAAVFAVQAVCNAVSNDE